MEVVILLTSPYMEIQILLHACFKVGYITIESSGFHVNQQQGSMEQYIKFSHLIKTSTHSFNFCFLLQQTQRNVHIPAFKTILLSLY